MWRWLWDAKFEILHGDRHDLFHLFKQLMYADSCEKLDELYEAGIQSDVVKRYPRFAAYLALQYTCRLVGSLLTQWTVSSGKLHKQCLRGGHARSQGQHPGSH